MPFIVLVALYFIVFASAGSFVALYLPATPAEAGPVPEMTGLLIVCAATVLVIVSMIHSSRWHGWKLIASLSVAFYLVMTLVTQLEAWYFLLGIIVCPELMARLFLQGIPTAFIFVAVAVLVMGHFRPLAGERAIQAIEPLSSREWLWKPGVIYIAYPIIRGSRLPLRQTALFVGLALSVPQNIGHILPNSLIPLNSVRMSHLIATVSSTFVFGLIVPWLLYPKFTTRKSQSEMARSGTANSRKINS